MKFDAIVGCRAAIAWVVLYSWLVHAHSAGIISMAEEAHTYDYESLMWAAAFGLMGGVFRTILSLMSEKVILLNFWKTLVRDLIFALVGGGAMYILIQALATLFPNIFSKEVRMLCILIAGASRGRWQRTLAGVASDGVANIRKQMRGSALAPSSSDEPPSSVAAPFIDK